MKVFTIHALTRSHCFDKTEESSGVLAVFTDHEKAIQYMRAHYKDNSLDYAKRFFRTYEDASGEVSAKSYRKYECGKEREESTITLETFELDNASNVNYDLTEIF